MSEKEYQDFNLSDEEENEIIEIDEIIEYLPVKVEETLKEEVIQEEKLFPYETPYEELDDEEVEVETVEVPLEEQTIKKEIQEDVENNESPFEEANFKKDTESFKEETNSKEETGSFKGDTSFSSFVHKANETPRSGFKKWVIRIAKLVVFLMCLPFLLLVTGGVVGGIIAFFGGSIALVGVGVGILLAVAFFASSLSGSIILLGCTSSITFLAGGTLAIILAVMLTKVIIRTLKQLFQKTRQHDTTREAR